MLLANLFSLFRVAVLPIIVYFLLQETKLSLSLALLFFAVAVFSDFLDSFVLRNRKSYSSVNSFLDPFADKILIGGLLLFFALQGKFWAYLLVFFIFRDIMVVVLRFMSSREDVILKHWIYTKLLTLMYYFVIFGLLLQEFSFRSGLESLTNVAYIVIVLFTVLSFLLAGSSLLHYIIHYATLIRKRSKRGRKVHLQSLEVFANKRSRGYSNRYRRRLLKLFVARRRAKCKFIPKQGFFTAMGVPQTSQVVIAGGDGTFESALNHPPFWKKSLGFFPLGAGNAFYSYFYKGKRFEYLRSRFPFHEMELDVVEIEWEGGKRQTLFANIGLDADVIRLSSKRTQHGFLDYVRGSVKATVEARSGYHLTMKVDGKKTTWKNCISVTLGKIPFLGFGIRSMQTEVLPNDSLVYGEGIINTHNTLTNKIIRIWALFLQIFNIDQAPLFPFKGKRIEITSSSKFPIQAGGEFLGFSTWAKLRVVRKQKVLVIE